jgi:predicted TIM-barrel fold metal-dependent hydrolase
VVETFGADRLAWGSNFPTSPGTLAEIKATAEERLKTLSDADRESIFATTAQKLYPQLAG